MAVAVAVAALPMSVVQTTIAVGLTMVIASSMFETIVAKGLSLRDRIHNIFKIDRRHSFIRLMTVKADVCVRVSGSGEILRLALDEKANA